MSASIRDVALNLIQRNPNVANNPAAQNYISVIRSGDNNTGSTIANNLCETYGVSKEEAVAKAKEFFGIQ